MNERPALPPPAVDTRRYVRYVGLLALAIIVLITINTVVSTPRGGVGLHVGKPLPPFAAPLAAGGLVGDADLATHTNAGAAGRVPACQERGTGILNICQLYQRGPVAVALVVVGSSCVRMLRELAAALPQFPGLQVAGVAVRGNRAAAARLARELPFPLGYDRDGAIATVYEAVACPQLTLAYPGGVVAAKPLYVTPSQAALDARLRTFYRSSIARGWKAPRK